MSNDRKELVDWVRGIYQNLNDAEKRDAIRFFPELRESEDEKIRKEIIKFIQDFCNPCDPDCDKWVAYLEKQRGHKFAWNKEDDKKIELLSFLLTLAEVGEHVTASERRELGNFLKSLRPRPSWKPSEEQMKALDKAIPVCAGVAGKDEISPLISLYEELKKLCK